MHHSATIRALADITDEGLFERLATAVLREVEPNLYANLAHPGMTSKGKTRPSPVDNIGFVLEADPPHMVVTHHATGPGKSLKKKWLHEPTNQGKRRSVSKSQLGDMIKTIGLVHKERKRTPNLRVTLALTTNHEPSEELMRDVQAVANLHHIAIDLWPASRIAHHLDNSPEGQWLRHHYLQIRQERLSTELLAELSHRSLAALPLLPSDDELINRRLDQTLHQQAPRPIALLVGESGFGKTIACYKHLKSHIDGGGYGLVLRHETLALHATLDQAIDAELRVLHPSLELDAGTKARALCSFEKPFLIVLEDVNWANRPALLLERLVGWSTSSNSKAIDRHNWRLLCPVWPKTLETTSEEAKKRLETISISVMQFGEDESRLAIKRRAKLANKTISLLKATNLAQALGHDPLLIALYDFDNSSESIDVIGQFVQSRLRKLCRGRNSITLTDCRTALQMIGERMIEERELDPSWSDVRKWLHNDPDGLKAIRQIIEHGEIVRLAEDIKGVERFHFRHDRVRAWLLSQTVAELMRTGRLQDTTLAEPFFAEVIGSALAKPDISEGLVERVAKLNPLALFYALKVFRNPETQVHTATLKAIKAWLIEDATHHRANRSLRWAALQVLAETDSAHVIPITVNFHDDTWGLVMAQLRNGDVTAGVELCRRVNPGATAVWRDREIEHAKSNHGRKLIRELDDFLTQPELLDSQRIGALRLAGHLGEPELAKAISVCWTNDHRQVDHLSDYLWAAAQCGGDNPSLLLKPMCAVWAKISDQAPKDGWGSPREDVSADALSWAFAEVLPAAAGSYFVKRAHRKDLRWPITLLLRGVDQPDAVEFIARVIAAQSRTASGFWTFPGDIVRDWERRQSLGRPMSSIARQRLLDLWKSEKHDKHLRPIAFRLWSATAEESDLTFLREASAPASLSDEILWSRVRRGDSTAIPAFVNKLQGDHSGYWWQLGRYTWSPALTVALEEELQRRATAISRDWNSHYHSDWIVSEIIHTRLPSEDAERVLQQNWEHLRYSRHFIEAALLIATPGTSALVAKAIEACPDPSDVFKFVQFHFSPKSEDGLGIDRLAQVKAFVPYLDFLDSHAIFTLWDTCNRLGWFAFRRQYLDSRLDEKTRKNTLLDESDFFTKLDEHIGRGGEDWADFLIDRYLEQTDRVDDIISLLHRWLRDRMTISAFTFVAAALRYIGIRGHLQMLSVAGLEPSSEVEAIRADTIYAVSQRSLT